MPPVRGSTMQRHGHGFEKRGLRLERAMHRDMHRLNVSYHVSHHVSHHVSPLIDIINV
jgi:cysteinyl-tRNA synthetase